MLKIFVPTLIIIGSMCHTEPIDTTQISTLTLDSRIVGGYQSNIIRVPYYVYITLQEGGISRSCGGSIISRTWVLTAAHCLFRHRRRIPDNGIIIDAGLSSLDIPREYEQMRHVIHSLVYESWINPIREQIVNHDVALLETCTSWEYNSWVQPIALAPRNYVLPDGIHALACGFGDTKTSGPGHGSRELYAVVLRKQQCWAGRPVQTILCFEGITSTLSGICHGDSGGPLMYLDNQTPVLIGVASGTGCKKLAILVGLVCGVVVAETTVNGIRASNVLGGPEEHASFSFVRPGLTQTSYAFNGPSSHQSFSSSIGNPHLTHKVLPNVANALAYRNPGLGYFPTAPVSTGYASSPYVHSPGIAINSPLVSGATVGFPYQQPPQLDHATALAYLHQYQQQRQQQQNYQNQIYSRDAPEPIQQTSNPEITSYQAQLGQIFALRQQQALLQLQSQTQSQHHQRHGQMSDFQQIAARESSQEVPEQSQPQQQVQQPGQNLLGVAYSSAPSVAHVQVTGNGYKFNF